MPTSPQVVGQGGGQQFGRVSGTGYDIQLQNTNGQVPRVITVSHDVDGDGDDDTLNFIDGDGDDMFVGQVILANGKAVHTTAEIFTRADLLQALDMGPHTPSRFQTAATVKAGETFEIQVVDSDGDDVPEAYMINIGGTDHGREGIAHRGDLNTQSLGRIE